MAVTEDAESIATPAFILKENQQVQSFQNRILANIDHLLEDFTKYVQMQNEIKYQMAKRIEELEKSK
jgi:uncharacterized membrane protein YgaE (UPF0421/DUF939 family)